MWYKLATKLETPPKPGEVEIPAGMIRRFHYTKSDELLPIIAKEGLKVNKSESWKYGDPKAVWSNPEIIRGKPSIEYWESPKHIISNQYQFKDVSPEQIVAIHPSWHSKLHYVLDILNNGEMSKEEIIRRLNDIKDIQPYDKILEILNNVV